MLLWKSQSLAYVLDDALRLVRSNRPGQYGVLRPEVVVYPLYKLIPQSPGEVEVDVWESRHLLRYEPFQREIPLRGSTWLMPMR